MRKPFIAANWKMNKILKEAVEFTDDFKLYVKDVKDVDILVCVPFTLLSGMKKEIEGTNIKLGAQNLYYEDFGAYTGEISAPMIKEFAEYVLIGHSDRRAFFNETNQILNKKIKKALEHGLKVIYCIGEVIEERKQGKTKQVIETQLREGLANINDLSNIAIAYEPVWAISRGDPDIPAATPQAAQEVHSFIREMIGTLYGKETSQQLRILYGGSMKPSNVKELMAQEDIDGGLVGGASLKADSFAEIVNFRK
ncbi:triose-phosphate isomerase [Candidatus Woesearchaeota archaeon]|nr:triose-phosphate isomerase [Candidatus Woesearchaeota archaeon]